MPSQDDIKVIAPNLNSRLSGVTATVISLVPLQARQIGIVATGIELPDSLPFVPLWKLHFLKRQMRVWHARRSSEMLAGILLKRVLGKRLKLLFTSASQRQHTRYSKWLIGQMDHVISTSRRTAERL